MNYRKRIAVEVVMGLLLICGFYLVLKARNNALWPSNRIELDSGYHEVMGTFAHIAAVTMNQETAKKCIETALEQIQLVDKLMSDYKSDSEISRVNQDAFRHPVRVGSMTFEVLQRAVKFSRLSDGAFDVTIGPLVDLWHRAGESNSLPTQAQRQQAKSKVGYEKLLLDPNRMTVKFAVDGMRLDLGAIAKGYSVDLAIEAMQQLGALGGMVDVGGDIRCFGAPPPGKKTWLIGIQDPRKAEDWPGTGRPLMVLHVVNAAVVTSGNYRRFVSVKGKKHSHIIDAGAGESSEQLASVTIIGNNATDADALATAVSVLGAEKGIQSIKTIPGTEAILITGAPEFKVIKTSGAAQYIQ